MLEVKHPLRSLQDKVWKSVQYAWTYGEFFTTNTENNILLLGSGSK